MVKLTLGDVLKFYREHCNLQQYKLAKMVNIQRQYINNIENNRSMGIPPAEKLIEIANVLGIDSQMFLKLSCKRSKEEIEKDRRIASVYFKEQIKLLKKK